VEKSDAADSLLSQAWAAERRGETDEAVALFRRVVTEYPNAAAAHDAQAYLAGVQHLAKPVSAEARREAYLAGAGVPHREHPAGPPGGPPIQRVTVVDVDISFGQLVSLFVKAAIALVPAAIILAIIGFIVFVIVGAFALRSGY